MKPFHERARSSTMDMQLAASGAVKAAKGDFADDSWFRWRTGVPFGEIQGDADELPWATGLRSPRVLKVRKPLTLRELPPA